MLRCLSCLPAPRIRDAVPALVVAQVHAVEVVKEVAALAVVVVVAAAVAAAEVAPTARHVQPLVISIALQDAVLPVVRFVLKYVHQHVLENAKTPVRCLAELVKHFATTCVQDGANPLVKGLAMVHVKPHVMALIAKI